MKRMLDWIAAAFGATADISDAEYEAIMVRLRSVDDRLDRLREGIASVENRLEAYDRRYAALPSQRRR